MSSQSDPVTAQHIAYLAGLTTAEDPFLSDLKVAARAAGIPEIWISPEQAALMQILLRLRGARQVVEVGTLAGYSAIAMARALPADGVVRTLEIEDAHADFAEEWIAGSDVAGKVQVIRGPAGENLPAFAAESADACFIDADKEGYGEYLDQCMRILRPGGLVMADNAFAFGELFSGNDSASVAAIRAFNAALAQRTDLQAIIVPLGDGCWVGSKLATPPPQH